MFNNPPSRSPRCQDASVHELYACVRYTLPIAVVRRTVYMAMRLYNAKVGVFALRRASIGS